MPSKYFVYNNDKYYGPLTAEEVRSLIEKRKISLSHYLYDVNLKYVFMIGEHKSFSDLLPVRPSDKLLHRKYILIKANQLAQIFSLEQLRESIAKGRTSVYEYVYIPHNNQISLIKDLKYLEEFFPRPPIESPTDNEGEENIILVKKKSEHETLATLAPELARRFPRAPFSAATRVSIEGNNYIGNCSVIGEGGCFIEIKNTNFKVGDSIKLNIVSDLIHLEIVVNAEITSIVKEFKAGIGVRFIDLKDEDRKKISQYIDRYIEQVQL
jgi:hypothetical protein